MEKGLAWQKHIADTNEKLRKWQQTMTVKAAADASALIVLHDIESTDKYFSLDSLDSLVVMLHPTVFLAQSLLYRSMAPQTWDLTRPPVTYQEAVARLDADQWRSAMETEKSAMDENSVFDPNLVVELPKGKKVIGLQWVFSWKEADTGCTAKAWIIAQGHTQQLDDCGNTYTPVAKMMSIRVVLTYAAKVDLELFTFDVCTAFLNASLHCEVYVHQIPGYQLENLKAFQRLRKALYGLKQSPHEWFREFSFVLHTLGLNLPIHVDNGLTAMNSVSLYNWLIRELNKQFSIKDLGPASMFLGICIERDCAMHILWLPQKHFVMDLLETHNMLQCTKSSIPLHTKLHQLPPLAENALPDIADQDIQLLYQSLTSSYIYLAVTTRPDLAFTAMALGQYNAAPTWSLLSAAKGVLKYLNATSDFALEYGGEYHKEKVGPDVVVRSDLALIDVD